MAIVTHVKGIHVHGQLNVYDMLPCQRHQPVASNVMLLWYRNITCYRNTLQTDNEHGQINACVALSMLVSVLVKFLVAMVAHVRGMTYMVNTTLMLSDRIGLSSPYLSSNVM